jgi:hypothetical protein
MISIFPLWTFHLYVEAGIKFNFSEFIFIFDLVFFFLLFWTNIEKKYGNKILLTFDFFLMKDHGIRTGLSRKYKSNSTIQHSLFENISGGKNDGQFSDERIGTVF